MFLDNTRTNFIGYFGNKALLLYSPKKDQRPSIDLGDSTIYNLLFCSDFNIFARQEASSENGLVAGHPDRNYFVPSPVTIQGTMSQKMLAYTDNSPDYTLARLYEHCRHVWAGYEYTNDNDGSGVTGIPGSVFSPYFSIFSDVFGTYSECLINSMEFIINQGEQVTINYNIVANRIWPEDAQTIREILSNYVDQEKLYYYPVRGIWSFDCGISTSVSDSELTGIFALPSEGDSPFLQGYYTPITPIGYVTNIYLKIDNFLSPNFTMQSSLSDLGEDYEEIKYNNYKRFIDNIYARNWVPSRQRLISGRMTWITDATPIEVFQKIVGVKSNQVAESSTEQIAGQDLVIIIGPMKIRIKQPVYSMGIPKINIAQPLQVDIDFFSLSDGELILSPYES